MYKLLVFSCKLIDDFRLNFGLRIALYLLNMRMIFLAILVLLSFLGMSQNEGDVKSIQLYPLGNELGDPIIRLGGNTPLLLEFDILGEEAPLLSYTIEHYSYNWEKSRINPNEYIEGFASGSINEYDFSFDSEQYYTHYTFEFPNRRAQPIVSGNYKIIVSDGGDVLFERSFMVTEQRVQITGQVDNAAGLGKRDSHHQINFSMLYEGLSTINPREEFKVNVFQNMRPDNALYNLQAQRVDAQRMYFNNPFKQNFDAGNQFRWFNTKSFRYKTQGVVEYLQKTDGVHAYLIPDKVREATRFVPYNDFNGRFRIERQEGVNDDVNADYAFVHFYLQEQPSFADKEVYLYGALTNWKIDDKYKLEYDPKQNLLSTVQYLKQGNYDYTYLVKDGDTYTTSLTEGSTFRTENQYTIFAYYSPFGSRYDRLVGVSQLDSRFN